MRAAAMASMVVNRLDFLQVLIFSLQVLDFGDEKFVSASWA